ICYKHIFISYNDIRISYKDIGFSSKDILKSQGETDNVLFHLISPLAFTRYSLIHRHFKNQVKAMNGNNLIVALMIL
ncbi:hypothetical protein, partial [Bacteroides caecimuris]|uniref:hypothetical protein n=3 Tax=Bacteroides caecimuris TaxID=1796613 RepID=UPI0026E53531